MIFLHRFKKYIIKTRYLYRSLISMFIIINHCLYRIIIKKNIEVLLHCDHHIDYMHYLNGRQVKRVILPHIKYNETKSTFYVQIENPRGFMEIYLFNKNVAKNTRSIIIDQYRRVMYIREW